MEGPNQQAQAHPSFEGVLRRRAAIRGNLSKIRHRIGVYSAKGGVGKTTVAVNLAYALKMKGFKVGLLDADIDCPNLPLFLGMDGKMQTGTLPLRPLEKDGVRVASTAMLVDDAKGPIIWRGPLIAKMLYDLLGSTAWGELDYLIVDLPPGTSDSPLTVMQVAGLDGFVIVTTPQRIAGVNSARAGLMARRLGVHVFGVVENMSGASPSASTGELAKALGTGIIGRVPADRKLADLADAGRVPVMELDEVAAIFEGIATKLPQ